MPRRTLAALALLAAVSAVSAQSAEESYRKLAKEYEDALAQYQKAFLAAKSDEERDAVLREKHPPVGEYAAKFVTLARKNPDTSAALDALVWVVNHPLPPTSAESLLREKALDALAKDHADQDRVGSLCTGLVRGIDPGTEGFLRGVRKAAKRAPVKARGTASLALNLRHRARLIATLGKDKTARKQYESSFGKDAIASLLEQDAKKLQAECETLLEEVRDKYAEVPHPIHGTFELYARRNLLAIRKPVAPGQPAPPISGEDLDGTKLSLSQFEGKVVLIDFWSHAFGPCRDMYATERKLAERMDGKPFAILGVNGDHDREATRKVAQKEKMTWRSLHDGGATAGPAATRYDVEVWPTVVLVDHAGVVRHVFVGWPEPKALEKLIDEMVAKAK